MLIFSVSTFSTLCNALLPTLYTAGMTEVCVKAGSTTKYEITMDEDDHVTWQFRVRAKDIQFKAFFRSVDGVLSLSFLV